VRLISKMVLLLGAVGMTLSASNITSIQLSGGSYSGGVFTSNGSLWDTLPNNIVWVLGVTNPSVGAPFLNNADTSLTPGIPLGTYWTYNEPGNFGTAIQFTVSFDDQATVTGVFSVGSLSSATVWTQLAGSATLSVSSTGQTGLNRVQGGDTPLTSMTPGTTGNDNVLQLSVSSSVPEPGTSTLLLVGIGSMLTMVGARRKLHVAKVSGKKLPHVQMS
jgi:PEP-CTERM motif